MSHHLTAPDSQPVIRMLDSEISLIQELNHHPKTNPHVSGWFLDKVFEVRSEGLLGTKHWLSDETLFPKICTACHLQLS